MTEPHRLHRVLSWMRWNNANDLTDVNKWVGEGSKATLANALNADILVEIMRGCERGLRREAQGN